MRKAIRFVFALVLLFVFMGCALPFVPKKPVAMVHPATKQVVVVDHQSTDGSTRGGVEARKAHQLEVESLEARGFTALGR